MRRFLLIAALFAATPALADPLRRDLYVGVNLVDPKRETITPDSYILVENGRIAAIGRGRPAAARGATLHDFAGLYALPGLIDTHAHLTLGPVQVLREPAPPRMRIAYDEAITAHAGRMFLSYGVTTVRNPGGDPEQARAYEAALAAGTLQGPEMRWAAEVIDRQTLPFEGLVAQVTPETPVAEIVRRQAAAGADYVKLYISLTEAEVREGVDAAHALGLQVIAHLDDVSWTRAAELGVDALVHAIPSSPDLLPAERRAAFAAARQPGSFTWVQWYEAADFDAPEMRDMMRTLAERRVHFDATLIAFEPAFFGNDPARPSRDAALAHPAMVENWRTLFRFDLAWTPDYYRRAQVQWPRLLELTGRMHAAGVPMTIGTDFGNPWVAPGLSMSQEMALHQQAGIPAWAVLRMATSDAARLIGLGHRTGALQRGLEADIVFIAANPLPDLNRVAEVRAVVNNGVLYRPVDLRQAQSRGTRAQGNPR
jgi:cytosine/adenosine deaminase-related metal-dependent hydrolase